MKLVSIILSLFAIIAISNFSYSQSEQFYNKTAFSDIIEDGEYYWITSSKSGLIKWNKSGNETTYFNKANSGLLSSKLLCIHKDAQNNIWIGTEDIGILKFDGTNWINYNTTNSDIPVNHIIAITGDNNGNIYIGTYLGGAAKLLTGNSWEIYNTSNSGIAENTIESIFVGSDGKVYFGWTNLSILDGTTWQTFNYNDMGCGEYWNMDEDSEGNIWLASYSYGFAKYDGENFTVFNMNNSDLPINYMRDIYIDENKNIWLASNGEGLIKYDGANFETFYPTIDGYDIKFWNKISINGSISLFMIAYNKFVEFNGTDFNTFNLENEPDEITHVNDINIVGDKKYISTNNSFLVRNNNDWIDELYDFSFTYNSAIGKNDTLFTASRNGLRKYNGTEYVSYTSYNSDVKDDYIYCIASDTNGTIWFSPKDKGLQAYKNGSFINNPYDGNLCSLTITELFVDSRGYIWAGSYRQGLSYYKDSIWHTEYINPDDENSFQYIVDFDENADGEVFISTNSGLAKFVDSSYEIVNKNINGAITFDADNNLWAYSSFGEKGSFLVKYTDSDSTVYDPAITRVGYDGISDLAFDNEGYLWIGYSEAGIMKFDVNNPNHTELVDPPTEIKCLENCVVSNINIFPNPTNGYFEIVSTDGNLEKVVVTDIQGRLITEMKGIQKSKKIDLSGFSKGTYVISSTANGITHSKKLLLK